jgi:hypothetical protein
MFYYKWEKEIGIRPDTTAGMLRLVRFLLWIVLLAKLFWYLIYYKWQGNRILGQIPTLVCSDSSDIDLLI